MRGALDQSRDLECLSQAIYYEARGETAQGQAAVAQVVLNRVRHPAFPKSVCAVVFQGAKNGGCQFSFACDNSTHRNVEGIAWRRAEKVAAQALDGQVMSDIGNATHFHVVGLSTPWGPRMMKVAQVGAHVFYRFGGHTGAPGMFHAEPQPSDKPAATPAEIKPIFASLAPNLSIGPGGPGQPTAGQLIASTAAVVQNAAQAVENAAKAAVAPQPEVAKAPSAPAPAKTADAAISAIAR